jgi:hypothetical protein
MHAQIMVFFCEVIVDWVKHSFITKFNCLAPVNYSLFHLNIRDDYLLSRRKINVRSVCVCVL